MIDWKELPWPRDHHSFTDFGYANWAKNIAENAESGVLLLIKQNEELSDKIALLEVAVSALERSRTVASFKAAIGGRDDARPS